LFGRIPERNAMLGRASTDAELAFLQAVQYVDREAYEIT